MGLTVLAIQRKCKTLRLFQKNTWRSLPHRP